MNEITQSIRRKAFEKLKPLLSQLISEGVEKDKIVQAARFYTDNKISKYYKIEDRPRHFKDFMRKVVDDLKSDSRAERILYKLLIDNEIDFEFQYRIGPYKADYLIAGYLVLELDGAGHDKEKDQKRDEYLNKLGYEVVRIPLWILSIMPNTIVEEIKEHATGEAP